MKILLFSIFFLLIVSSGKNTIQQKDILLLPDVEKILGEPARLTEKKTTIEKKVLKERRTYAALAKEPATGKTGMLYYGFDQYPSKQAAIKRYKDVVVGNQPNGNLKPIMGMGDEAFIQTDGSNFYLLMARKSNKIILIKVNKITSHTSETGLKEVASNLVKQL
jgi:hypothetical protein